MLNENVENTDNASGTAVELCKYFTITYDNTKENEHKIVPANPHHIPENSIPVESRVQLLTRIKHLLLVGEWQSKKVIIAVFSNADSPAK